ncbi:hypothetical protein PBY51_006520 [Eleginops maclovinus]|uniref:Uncharacterized protein n=1 Tax=Eleginops maclovinus TaxID=56733 RepID=A0AAN7X4D6_ELEMC|nr:hypothetical protein PBY51_006520 [Eleginops maclovinus]
MERRIFEEKRRHIKRRKTTFIEGKKSLLKMSGETFEASTHGERWKQIKVEQISKMRRKIMSKNEDLRKRRNNSNVISLFTLDRSYFSLCYSEVVPLTSL